ncbi:NUDIX domain-containing protein [Altererythrobacter xixiisoli]|uniref:NUDIX domain-containing protein n=1 Tax=Croceibacterium xixiisoli TaxID=1476466 RepID=A0A6I4TTX2_9SPHN|nr:NUDIX domain-containing protein [Croceibacterium xixiisoli]MXO98591.1 NUDIX domain-containing protein [Croceibacterium xixiisoli]
MDEREFLQGYDPAAYDRPSLTVDLVLFGISQGQPAVLLLRRDDHPFANHWALPGGFVAMDEGLEDAAQRVLADKARLQAAHVHLEQLYTFGAVDRDPRMRIISVAWLALLDDTAFASALAGNPALIPARVVLDGDHATVIDPDGAALPIAFDHAQIIALALTRLRGKLDYSDVGFALLPACFTLRELQHVHEAILGTPLNKPAFRRRMLDKGWLTPTGTREQGTSYRPAELYRVTNSV